MDRPVHGPAREYELVGIRFEVASQHRGRVAVIEQPRDLGVEHQRGKAHLVCTNPLEIGRAVLFQQGSRGDVIADVTAHAGQPRPQCLEFRRAVRPSRVRTPPLRRGNPAPSESLRAAS